MKNCFFCCCIFCLLLTTTCSTTSKKEEAQVYYYEMYTDMDSIPTGYQIIKIVDSNDIRKQFTYNYFVNTGIMVFESKQYYKILGDDLFKLNNIEDNGVLYLSTKHKDSCITYSTGDEIMDVVLAETHCFQGKKSIIVNNNEFKTAYEFYKTYGKGFDNVMCRVYYDTSLIPIKEEWISGGYTSIDSIRRTSCIPFESISRLKCVKYKKYTFYIRDSLKTQQKYFNVKTILSCY